ncbi:BlaR1 family beta-lactam sensor/signal transducer [Salipaludibacillus agaradhaerens]|uniref:BlaR1 family beta-lactam sensor/signal transducer n=1 Tax=Salipaludibacillus agaradhaerens TaxID=76935 RepID=A0A9Q4G0M5_SALAG|nr:BlaR1 family beta-lactam sensor/signal transducer [Salipaludibacillus agaradhaerens]MCR6098192.1 BlaR1 family beta-lactam sensor/signal transducer [Salipaludibacillus agaradhaerens]MCR6116178.1 BlaR1 family beta-lactam sensor/signal transducer [Salipaludibacillus agaradhaerens]
MTLPHIVLSLVLSTVTIMVILLLRKFFYKQLSAKWRYHLWFLLIFALTFPFIPIHLVEIPSLSFIHESEGKPSSSTQDSWRLVDQSENWVNDFGTSVSRFDHSFVQSFFIIIWVIGMVLFFLLALYHYAKLQRLISAATEIKNVKVKKLYSDCIRKLGVKKRPKILETSSVRSPMTFGLFNTYILLPKDMASYLSDDEINYVLLHELHHYKSKHIKVNFLFVLYQIVYWFHPLVWKAFKIMRLDREMACDTEVLHSIDRCDFEKYGKTIIRFVERNKESAILNLATPLLGSEKHIKRRMIHIASFTEESKLLKLKSMFIFIVITLFLIAQFPLLSVTASSSERYLFDDQRAIYEDLSRYFGENEGSFVVYSASNDEYQIYNREKSVMRVSPNSSYKMFTALMALEEGVITGDDSLLEWDGLQYDYEEWHANHDLRTAMSYSVTWYFQELDRQIQRDRIQYYLEMFDYGNKDLSGRLDEYWLESSLKISPIEQVELLQSFYMNEYHFKEKNVQLVKEAIKLEETQEGTLFGKTGTGIVNDRAVNGWFIGFVETETDTYFFATNIQHQDHAYGSKAAEITQAILSSKGIYK